VIAVGGDLRDGRCPACGHDEVIEAESPLALTHERVALLGLRGFDPQLPRGVCVLYACRRCGRAEWWVKEPGTVPIGEAYGTRIVRAGGSGGPYR
jgi:hypothetical protein